METFTADRVVALVGRPNVGKSRLFNRLAGKRIAIVHDQAGVTRDVNETMVEKSFRLLDTGGIGLVSDMSQKALVEAAEEQLFVAVQTAGIICFVVDLREGCTPLDEMIAEQLRGFGRRVILVANKSDSPEMDHRVSDFAHLGFSEVITVSAEHGRGVDYLKGQLMEILGPAPDIEVEEERRIKICFTGRPNVGKSSLCNRLLNSTRLVVSEVPGTTRDSVSLNLDYRPKKSDEIWRFQLMDTAGVRRSTKLDSSVEYFSTVRSRHAIQDADIVFLVVDAQDGVTKQDQALMGEVVEAGKPCALIVNKWDVVFDIFECEPLKGYKNIDAFKKQFSGAALKELFFLPKSPSLFVSAKTGYSTDSVLRVAHELDERANKDLSTGRINKLLERLIKSKPPRFIKGKPFKVYYSVQVGKRPYKFKLFCNRETKLDKSYKRYLQSGFIDEFGLQGCPICFDLIGKQTRYSEPKKKKYR